MGPSNGRDNGVFTSFMALAFAAAPPAAAPEADATGGNEETELDLAELLSTTELTDLLSATTVP